MLTLIGRPVLAAIAAITSDALTKAWAESTLTAHEPVPIVGQVFQLTLTYNSGVAFGLFADGGPWLLTMSAAIILMIGVVLVASVRRKAYLRGVWALGLLLGGALANFTDRWQDGRVTDFLDAGVAATRWPTFNLADSFIMIGIFLLLIMNATIVPEQPKAS